MTTAANLSVQSPFTQAVRYEDKPEFPQWLNRFRKQSFESFKSTGFPGPKDEPWKYFPLEKLLDQAFEPATPGRQVGQLSSGDALTISLSNGAVFAAATTQAGLRLTSLKTLIREDEATARLFFQASEQSGKTIFVTGQTRGAHVKSTPVGQERVNPFVLMNDFCFEDAVVVNVAAGVTLEKPVHVSIVARDDRQAVIQHPRVLIHLEKDASAHVAVSYENKGKRHFSNCLTTVVLDEGASLHYVNVRAGEELGFRFDSLRASLASKSRFDGIFLNQDDVLTRLDTQINFTGPEASSQLNGLSLLSGESELHAHTFVNHLAESCFSTQVYKNILTDRAVSEFNGLVYVHSHAQKTDSSQSNRNLLLSDGARALSRPQLEIFADDVKCGHGANVGQLNETEVFYLTSRGLSEAKARALITYGFAEEIIERVKIGFVREYFEAVLAEKLEKMPR